MHSSKKVYLGDELDKIIQIDTKLKFSFIFQILKNIYTIPHKQHDCHSQS